MSKGIRYDSLLVRSLAATLDARLAGRRIRAVRFASDDRSIAFAFRDETVVWTLHPHRGWLTFESRRDRRPGIALPDDARIGRITSPPDERLIDIPIEGGETDGGHTRRIVVELFGTHRNALAIDAAGIVRAVLRPRPSGQRILAVAQPYAPLPPPQRIGATGMATIDQWRDLLGAASGDDRKRTLLARFAWTSPLNASFVLQEDDDLDGAYARYRQLIETRDEAWVLRPDAAPQPYPARLGEADARRESDIVAAFAATAALRVGAAAQDTFVADLEAALETVRERRARAALRAEGLRREMDGAPQEAAALRRHADLLLAQLHRIPRGAQRAELDDFEGGSLYVTLDPALTPNENATRLYDAARKRDRAAARIPDLLRAAEAEQDRLIDLEARIAEGGATQESLASLARKEGRRRSTDVAPPPYRLYRTTGGIEVRVGRGSRRNDELTFHHSSPDDIWLHAESVPGAHVILRWGRRDANPPAADLHEAAVLAALHSRARTSGTVPVVWTRRKYVRKPRKSGPGRVTMERAKTIFVEPQPALERKLRAEED